MAYKTEEVEGGGSYFYKTERISRGQGRLTVAPEAAEIGSYWDA